jgi:hypothetical protein
MKKTMFVAIAILAIILGIVAYATAVPLIKTDTVTVNASVNSLLTITVTAADKTINWLLVNPGSSQTQTEHITIDSNRIGVLSAAWAPDPSAYGLTSGLVSVTKPFGRGAGQALTDLITFAPSFTAPADLPITAVLTYTATQS